MNNEKIMILKMLEDGKITSAEAARLLEAAASPAAGGGTESKNRTEGHSTPSPVSPPPVSPSWDSEYSGSRSNNNRPGGSYTTHSSTGFEDFTSELSKKFETFARDMEPKIYKLSEAVAGKTAEFTDKISKSLASPPSHVSGSRAPSPTTSSSGMSERVFETSVIPGYNELSIAGLNGDVLIKGYNGDKISARIYYKAKKGGTPIELMKLGNKYFLNYEEDDFEKVSVDAFVPESLFNSLNIQTINGHLSVSTVKAQYLVLGNSGGKTDVSQISAENIKIDSNNDLLTLSDISGVNGQIENFNGSIQAYGVDVANLKMTAFNGGINMNIAYFNSFPLYVWAVETSNGKMTLNLPSAPDLGYYVKAHAALSSMKIGLTGLNYIYNEPSFIEAKSISFDMVTRQVRLSLETSNAPLHVN